MHKEAAQEALGTRAKEVRRCGGESDVGGDGLVGGGGGGDGDGAGTRAKTYPLKRFVGFSILSYPFPA